MSNPRPTFKDIGFNWGRIAIAMGVIAFATAIITLIYVQTSFEAAQRDAIFGRWLSFRPQFPAPDFSLLAGTPLSVQLHVFGVALAMLAASIIVFSPKGTGFHRMLGWAFAGAMIVVAVTSIMMIFDLGTGVNFLHIFTAMTVMSLWGGLTAIRRGDVRAHGYAMIGLFLGGLIVAGAFAFIPGRLMWRVFFGG